MSSRTRSTKGHAGNRRSHHGLGVPRLSKCANCGEYVRRHRACPDCGFYRGRQIVEIKKGKVVTADNMAKEENKATAPPTAEKKKQPTKEIKSKKSAGGKKGGSAFSRKVPQGGTD